MKMTRKPVYTLVEAAYALGRSTEYVRQRLPEGRSGNVEYDELIKIALPNMEMDPFVSGGQTFSKQQLTEFVQSL